MEVDEAFVYVPIAVARRRGGAAATAIGVVPKRARRGGAVVALVPRSLVCG